MIDSTQLRVALITAIYCQSKLRQESDSHVFGMLLQEELKGMAGRIIRMRQMLFAALMEVRAPGKWDHIMEQIGMFSFTGLTKVCL